MSFPSGKTLIFIAAAAFTSALYINFCATAFRCGCVSLWNGADAHCTVHITGTRHCPWCMHGRIASAIPYAFIIAAQAAVSFWPRPMSPAVRLLAAAAAFPVTGGLLALIYGVAAGYWTAP